MGVVGGNSGRRELSSRIDIGLSDMAFDISRNKYYES